MKRYLTIMAALATATVALATNPADPYAEVVRLALSNDPALAAIEAEERSADLERRAENRPEALSVDFGYDWISPEGGRRWNLEVTQSFDWPGVYAARNSANDHLANAGRYRQLAHLNDCQLQVRLMIIKAVSVQRRRRILHQASDLLDSLVVGYTKLYQAGEVTGPEMARLRMTLFEFDTALDDLNLEATEISATIVDIHGKPIDAIWQFDSWPDPLLRSMDEYTHEALTINPEMAVLRCEQQASQAGVRVECMSSWPGLTIGYAHETEGSEHFNGFRAGVSLPLWSSSKHRAAAQAAVQAADLQIEAAEASITARIATDYAAAANALRRMMRYADTFGANASDYPRMITRLAEAREISAMDMAREMQFYLEQRLAYEKLCCDYYLLQTTLERYSADF